ncbi:hypothetical protein BDW72DRAFT_71950 [Aspergillus terricola var. indicus]
MKWCPIRMESGRRNEKVRILDFGGEFRTTPRFVKPHQAPGLSSGFVLLLSATTQSQIFILMYDMGYCGKIHELFKYVSYAKVTAIRT